MQDFKDICAAMALTPEGIDASTTFLTDNIAKILKTMLSGESIVTYMYRTLASKVALDSEIIKVSVNGDMGGGMVVPTICNYF